jgi:hypothetical protein
MRKQTLLVVSLIVATPAFAQDDLFSDRQSPQPKIDSSQIVIDGGLGMFSTEGSSLSQVKFGKIGLQENLWSVLKQRFNVGAWLDSRGEGRTNSGFTGYQLGFDVQNEMFEASIWSGPTYITTPDIALGGNLQFNETIFFGIKDRQDDSIGVAYNHFSSAGLEMPNLGRDFMCVEIKFPF